jgi:hypothetical protein
MPLPMMGAGLFFYIVGKFQAGVLHRLMGGGYRQLGEAVGALDLFDTEVLPRLEALDLAGEGGGVAGGVKQGDVIYTALAVNEGLPGAFGIQAKGAEHAGAVMTTREGCAIKNDLQSAGYKERKALKFKA